jgi:glucosyl-3-phosphoglycerate synthase
VSRPRIDPALGLDIVQNRTLRRDESASVSVVIPAHNEAERITQSVIDALGGLGRLGGSGHEVIVAASGCTDNTAELAAAAGAKVVEAPIGKGAAMHAGALASTGEVICLIDGDLRYYGDPPLVPLLVDPILHGIADATISNLYWRPLYPQMWLHGFFVPLMGVLFPEILPKVGPTPWSGQRAVRRELWPTELPNGFTSDVTLLMHWNQHALRMTSVVTDDWSHPQRTDESKEKLMAGELEVILRYAVEQGRMEASEEPNFTRWYDRAHEFMAAYRAGIDDPQEFERRLLTDSMNALRYQLNRPGRLNMPS